MTGRSDADKRAPAWAPRTVFFNLPTLLTWARIVAIPLVVGVYYVDLAPRAQNLAGTVLFVLVALTGTTSYALAEPGSILRLNATMSEVVTHGLRQYVLARGDRVSPGGGPLGAPPGHRGLPGARRCAFPAQANWCALPARACRRCAYRWRPASQRS